MNPGAKIQDGQGIAEETKDWENNNTDVMKIKHINIYQMFRACLVCSKCYSHWVWGLIQVLDVLNKELSQTPKRNSRINDLFERENINPLHNGSGPVR